MISQKFGDFGNYGGMVSYEERDGMPCLVTRIWAYGDVCSEIVINYPKKEELRELGIKLIQASEKL